MNVYNVLLNIHSDYLTFEFDRCSHFNAFKAFISFSKKSFDLRFIFDFISIESVDSLNQFTSFMQNFNQFNKSTLRKTLNFRLDNSFTFSFNAIIKKSILFKLLNKSKTSINIVMIDAAAFYKLNF